MMPAPWRIAERWDETHDRFTLVLEPTEGVEPMEFAPGQFNMLYAFGAGESAISISGDPGAGDSALVHTIRRVGTVTSALSRLRPGDQIGLRHRHVVEVEARVEQFAHPRLDDVRQLARDDHQGFARGIRHRC